MRRTMARLSLAVGVAIAAIAGISISDRGSVGHGALTITMQQAEAQSYRAESRRVARRTARRTARRVERRYDYIRSLPRGCVWRGRYHYCHGIYYRPAVIDGIDVFIVVTP